MTTHEAWARRLAKRHTYKDNPASVSLARSLVVWARHVDADPEFPRHGLEVIASQLRACSPAGDVVEGLQAKMWARRCDALQSPESTVASEGR